MSPDFIVREASREDADVVLRFIIMLAEYERARHHVTATLKDIETLLGEDAISVAICQIADEPIGFVVYFATCSTWLGRMGAYIEDLFVVPEHRGNGAGRALLKHVVEIAMKNNWGRVEWSVLDWNEPAIGFYQSIGATPQSEWVRYRLTASDFTCFLGRTD